jgi:LAO/AO transport system kinase
VATLEALQQSSDSREKKSWLLTEKAYRLIERKRMSDLSRTSLQEQIKMATQQKDFNLYRFVKEHY